VLGRNLRLEPKARVRVLAESGWRDSDGGALQWKLARPTGNSVQPVHSSALAAAHGCACLCCPSAPAWPIRGGLLVCDLTIVCA
jgi:hypothetical protein